MYKFYAVKSLKTDTFLKTNGLKLNSTFNMKMYYRKPAGEMLTGIENKCFHATNTCSGLCFLYLNRKLGCKLL